MHGDCAVEPARDIYAGTPPSLPRPAPVSLPGQAGARFRAAGSFATLLPGTCPLGRVASGFPVVWRAMFHVKR